MLSSSSGYDCWIKKFDSSGNEDTANWNKIFENKTSDFYENIFGVKTDQQNSLIAAGYGFDLASGTSSEDWFIRKFYSNGAEETENGWVKIYSGSAVNGNDRALAVNIDSSGNIYAVGYGSNLVGGTSGNDWWIKKFLVK